MAKLYGILDNGNRGQKTYTAHREISSQLKTHDTTVDTHLFADGTTYVTIKRGGETVYLTIASGPTLTSDLNVTTGTMNPVLEQSSKTLPVTTLYLNGSM